MESCHGQPLGFMSIVGFNFECSSFLYPLTPHYTTPQHHTSPHRATPTPHHRTTVYYATPHPDTLVQTLTLTHECGGGGGGGGRVGIICTVGLVWLIFWLCLAHVLDMLVTWGWPRSLRTNPPRPSGKFLTNC